MKIYYYYFVRIIKTRLEKYVHDAEEKKATYKITDKPLEHMYYVNVRKDEIGKVISKYSDLAYVVLMEDDDEKAKKLFTEYYQGLIVEKQREIDELRAMIKKHFL